MAALWVLVSTTVLALLHRATAAPVVTAPWGRIQGLDSVSVSGLNYSSYLAIPYALPPVGDLRFAKPVAHPGYGEGRVLAATSLGAACLQDFGYTSEGVGMSEDCLTLNVFVPASVVTGPKSVMVWIHGGAYVLGDAAFYQPSELVTGYDVIVVVIQYRLGALGFLSTGDDTVPGNLGLWDQNLALRWVKTNIGAFGGDPESMTVFGESAGASSVGFQMISPASRGMAFRAILQSGTPLAPWAMNKNPGQAFYNLANQTGCLDGGVSSWVSSISHLFNSEAQTRAERERVLACFKRLDARELIRPILYDVLSLTWAPVIDGEFVPRDPAQLMNDPAYLRAIGATERDVMMGINNEEGAEILTVDGFADTLEATTSAEDRDKRLREVLEDFMVQGLVSRYGEGVQTETGRWHTLVDSLSFFYTPWVGAGAGLVTLQNLVDMLTDISYAVNTVSLARALANAKVETSATGRPYLYLFNHYPAYKLDGSELMGITHGEDLYYEFDVAPELADFIGLTNDEYTVASTFRAMLTSFAKTGQPQVPLLNSQTSGVNAWPEFTLTEERYLSLERIPRVGDHLYGQRVALWTHLVPALYNSTRAPQPSSPLLWQQQQQQQQTWTHNSPACQQMPQAFTFKGRISFFKLH